MSDILRLIRRDVRHAGRNVMAAIVIFGLIVIPSLFTWFNVIASWDPFANTSKLQVAVASTDDGYQSDLVPVRINVGEQVLSALRANDELDWVITTEDDAIDGTRSGKYYAAIVLPSTFSADMMTFYADDGTATRIEVYTNEKKNALAPKITEQGAEGVSSQITATFTETLSEIALGLISSMSDFLTDDDTRAALTRVEARVGAIGTQLRSAAQTADLFTSLIDGTLPLVDSASALVTSAGGAVDDTSTAIGGGADAVNSLTSTLSAATTALADALSATATSYDPVADRIDDLYAALDSVSADQAQVATTLAERVQQQIDQLTALRTTLDTEVRPLLPATAQGALDTVIDRLDDAIARQQTVHDRLTQAAQDITNGNSSAQTSHQEITDAIAEAKTAIQNARDAYTTGLKPQLDALATTLGTIRSDISTIRSDLQGVAAALSTGSESIGSGLNNAKAVTEDLSESLTSAADRFDELQTALAHAADTGDLSEISRVIGADPSVLAASLADPIRLDRQAVFPIASFGVGMAPLYTVLALWVGALLLTVAIRVDVPRGTLRDSPDLSPTQQYLGRYGIFALMGLAQSTLLTLGLLLFVRIEPAHPLLLVLAGWVISLVFTLLTYTAVIAFGNAGKALSVLLLVVQISGSGGAYPLQLLPPWFQSVSPFLPATYAIDALRAAIAGVYGADFWIALGMLALFILPALLLGLVLRRPLISFNRGLVEALESTKLMG